VRPLCDRREPGRNCADFWLVYRSCLLRRDKVASRIASRNVPAVLAVDLHHFTKISGESCELGSRYGFFRGGASLRTARHLDIKRRSDGDCAQTSSRTRNVSSGSSASVRQRIRIAEDSNR
jgi:hypothetical protein